MSALIWFKARLRKNLPVKLFFKIRLFLIRNKLIFLIRTVDKKSLSLEDKILRTFITAKREDYKNALVFIDRGDKADDNAEHLYRFLRDSDLTDTPFQEQDLIFVLSEKSKDWPRLRQDGFRLIDYGSNAHMAAQLNCRLLLSSHAGQTILEPLPDRKIYDLARYQFIFLQHGIIMTDISAWLNKVPARLFITSTHAEYEAISGRKGPYIFSPTEVKLTGLARHDTLLKRAAETSTPDTLLIMPTWRKYLTVQSQDKLLDLSATQAFFESDYARHWLSFLRSDTLKAANSRFGLKIKFAPHPNFSFLIQDVDLPDHIEGIDMTSGVSYQKLIAETRLLITDYSSIAAEAALLNRPLVYFQFDRQEMFGGSHTFKTGYFDFDAHGYGPAVFTLQDLEAQINFTLNSDEDIKYAQRRQNAFARRDGKNCQRILEALLDL